MVTSASSLLKFMGRVIGRPSHSETSKIDEESDEGGYPEPYVIEAKHVHKYSFIILHGRGANAKNFGPPLLMLDFPCLDGKEATLPEVFPNAKFIFPTASRRRIARLNRSTTTQWFDIWDINNQQHREGLQFNGLKETTAFIHKLMRTEIDTVGAQNVVLWGLSQGCAASLTAMLLWEGEKIAACVGMCGWLPIQEKMRDFFQERELIVGDNDPFDRDESRDEIVGDEKSTDPGQETVQYLAELINFELFGSAPSMMFREVPFFLGHGDLDSKVVITLGKAARDFLKLMGCEVHLEEYSGLGHWYSKKMLEHISRFLHIQLGMALVKSPG